MKLKKLKPLVFLSCGTLALMPTFVTTSCNNKQIDKSFPTSIEIKHTNTEKTEFELDETEDFSIKKIEPDTASKNVIWKTSNSEIVEFTDAQAGQVKMKKAGECDIYAVSALEGCTTQSNKIHIKVVDNGPKEIEVDHDGDVPIFEWDDDHPDKVVFHFKVKSITPESTTHKEIEWGFRYAGSAQDGASINKDTGEVTCTNTVTLQIFAKSKYNPNVISNKLLVMVWRFPDSCEVKTKDDVTTIQAGQQLPIHIANVQPERAKNFPIDLTPDSSIQGNPLMILTKNVLTAKWVHEPTKGKVKAFAAASDGTYRTKDLGWSEEITVTPKKPESINIVDLVSEETIRTVHRSQGSLISVTFGNQSADDHVVKWIIEGDHASTTKIEKIDDSLTRYAIHFEDEPEDGKSYDIKIHAQSESFNDVISNTMVYHVIPSVKCDVMLEAGPTGKFTNGQHSLYLGPITWGTMLNKITGYERPTGPVGFEFDHWVNAGTEIKFDESKKISQNCRLEAVYVKSQNVLHKEVYPISKK